MFISQIHAPSLKFRSVMQLPPLFTHKTKKLHRVPWSFDKWLPFFDLVTFKNPFESSCWCCISLVKSFNVFSRLILIYIKNDIDSLTLSTFHKEAAEEQLGHFWKGLLTALSLLSNAHYVNDICGIVWQTLLRWRKFLQGCLKCCLVFLYAVNHHLLPKTMVWDQVNESRHFSCLVVGSAQPLPSWGRGPYQDDFSSRLWNSWLLCLGFKDSQFYMW